MSDIYHERQSLQLCALHVVNNLLQRREFSKSELDAICLELAPDSYPWWNPHRSPLGLGNYDVNVIMTALQRRGFDTVWFDKRRDFRTVIRPEAPFGFILNVPSPSMFAKIFPKSLKPKHWIAIKRIENQFYNLDSHLAEPGVIGEANEFLDFISEQLQQPDGRELIVVVDPRTTSDAELYR